MDNKLEIFSNTEFGKLRTIEVDGKIMFVASDVAKMLGYSNISDAISRHCRYVAKHDIPHPQGEGTLEVNMISEGDVYRLITHSKLPAAEKFESWVFDDVLPAIRKHGSYTSKPADNLKAERLAVMKRNAKVREASLWAKLAQEGNETFKQVCRTYAANILAEKEVIALPEASEKTYTATEIGTLLGISANKVGRLAVAHNLKTEKYGKWYHDKSRHSSKEVETFRYYENAIDELKSILKAGDNHVA